MRTPSQKHNFTCPLLWSFQQELPGVSFRWLEVEGPMIDQWPTPAEQLLFANLAAASLALNTFYLLLCGYLHYSEIGTDIAEGLARPIQVLPEGAFFPGNVASDGGADT